MNLISNKSLLRLLSSVFIFSAISLASCKDDEPNSMPNQPPVEHPKAPAYVLNEGNFSDGTGVLGMIDEKGMYHDSLYYKANGHLLGNVAQDLFMYKNEIFIITQNGEKNGGFAQLFIAEYPSIKEKKVYKNSELTALNTPSHVVANDKYIYLRDSKGISILDRASSNIKFIAGTEKAAFTQMAMIDNKVFAINDKAVLIINGETLEKTIEYKAINLFKMADSKLLLINSELTELAILDPKTTNLDKYDISSLGLKKVQYAKVHISAYRNDVIIAQSSGKTKIYKYNLQTKVGVELIDLKTISEYANMMYGGTTIDSKTGALFAVTIKGWGMDYKTNAAYYWGKFDNKAITSKSENMLLFPAGIFPVNNF